MRDTLEMAREACVSIRGHYDETGSTPQELERLIALARADEREVSLDAVLRVIKELYPALVLAAFSNRDKAWAIDKIKESIEKLKETK
jgi:hypothetical protein